MFGIRIVLAISCAAVLSAGSAGAATVTLEGDNVFFEYDTQRNADVLQVVTPTVQGDTVRFLPPQFRAESVDGGNTDMAISEFSFDRIYTRDGREIESLSYTEFGDYELTGSGNIDVDLFISVGNNLNLDELLEDQRLFSWDNDSDGLQTWQLDSSLLPALAFADPAHDIRVHMRTIMTANSGAPGDAAWVQSKVILLTATPVAVPLPATAWMFFSGLGLFISAYRRLVS